MSSTLHAIDELIASGLADPARREILGAVASRYAVAITPPMAELAISSAAMARQFVPHEAELATRPEELADPIGDEAHAPVDGIVHRYPDRVLLKAVGVCAVYCRFCFRRESVGPGKGEMLSPEALDTAVAYIESRPEIWEVILSGGDPLVLSPRRLGDLMRRLGGIAHVRVVRLHTRVPVVDPGRITDELVAALKASGRATWLVLHANHADELGPAARDALARLADAGIPLLSQSVLLAGVNDEPAALEALLRALVENRVKPYYLHHGDLAPGTAHFRTSVAAGQSLVRGLRGNVSGLCQPTYVLDIPGGHGKSPIGPAYLGRTPEGLAVEDWRGGCHAYRESPADEAT